MPVTIEPASMCLNLRFVEHGRCSSVLATGGFVVGWQVGDDEGQDQTMFRLSMIWVRPAMAREAGYRFSMSPIDKFTG